MEIDSDSCWRDRAALGIAKLVVLEGHDCVLTSNQLDATHSDSYSSLALQNLAQDMEAI